MHLRLILVLCVSLVYPVLLVKMEPFKWIMESVKIVHVEQSLNLTTLHVKYAPKVPLLVYQEQTYVKYVQLICIHNLVLVAAFLVAQVLK